MTYKHQRKRQISEYRYKRKTERPTRRWDKSKATIERRRPPAWDPPILLLAVSWLLVVVLVGRVVVVAAIVDRGDGLRGSVIWLQQWDMGEKENKATVSTAKYSASKDLHYICNLSKGGCIGGLGCRNARIERRPSPIED
jgi:hypothetical protein